MSRSYFREETKDWSCEENPGRTPVRISLERGNHMGASVAFVSKCEQYDSHGRHCILSGKPCPYSIDGKKALEAFGL
jgi:hypothetical protein